MRWRRDGPAARRKCSASAGRDGRRRRRARRADVTGSTPRPAEAIQTSSAVLSSPSETGRISCASARASWSTASRVVPGRIRGSLGGVISRSPLTTNTVLEDPSVSQPSRSRIASEPPASPASCRSNTLASSAIDLMSHRAQRMSSRVTAAMPCASSSGEGAGYGAANPNTVGATSRRERMVAPALRAARHLQVDELFRRRRRARRAHPRSRPIARACADCAMPDGREAACQPVEVLRAAETAGRDAPARPRIRRPRTGNPRSKR